MSKTGDTMSGNLTISNGDPYVLLTNTYSNKNIGIHTYKESELQYMGLLNINDSRHVFRVNLSSGSGLFVGDVYSENGTHSINDNYTRILALGNKISNLGAYPFIYLKDSINGVRLQFWGVFNSATEFIIPFETDAAIKSIVGESTINTPGYANISASTTPVHGNYRISVAVTGASSDVIGRMGMYYMTITYN